MYFAGFAGLSPMNLLSTPGLVNYFGSCDDLMDVSIDPILMKKGDTQLALYGLGHIPDDRLLSLFNDAKIKMERPDEKKLKNNVLNRGCIVDVENCMNL